MTKCPPVALVGLVFVALLAGCNRSAVASAQNTRSQPVSHASGHGPCTGPKVGQVVAEAVRSEIERVSGGTYRLGPAPHQTTTAIRPEIKSISISDSISTGDEGGALKNCSTTVHITVRFNPVPGVAPNDVIRGGGEPRRLAAQGFQIANYPEIAQAFESLPPPCGTGPVSSHINPYFSCVFSVVDNVEYELQPVTKTYEFTDRRYQVGTSDQGDQVVRLSPYFLLFTPSGVRGDVLSEAKAVHSYKCAVVDQMHGIAPIPVPCPADIGQYMPRSGRADVPYPPKSETH